jgi:hypothetical protein
MLRPATRPALVGSVAFAVGLALAGPASARTLIGSTFLPTQSCGSNFTLVQTTGPPGTSYTVPTAGVLTAWFVRTGTMPPQLKLKVFRPAGGADFTVIGASAGVVPLANSTTVSSIRIPVKGGDIIGATVLTNGNCATASGSYAFLAGDAAVGSTLTYTPMTGSALPIGATLEDDADGDLFGDESQDACPSQASAGAACDFIAPDTRITAGTRTSFNGKATYAFTATDAAARFECRLEGGRKKLDTFRPCSSPAKYKHLKPGKYRFFVRGVDPFGNLDTTPAKKKLTVRSRP